MMCVILKLMNGHVKLFIVLTERWFDAGCWSLRMTYFVNETLKRTSSKQEWNRWEVVKTRGKNNRYKDSALGSRNNDDGGREGGGYSDSPTGCFYISDKKRIRWRRRKGMRITRGITQDPFLYTHLGVDYVFKGKVGFTQTHIFHSCPKHDAHSKGVVVKEQEEEEGSKENSIDAHVNEAFLLLIRSMVFQMFSFFFLYWRQRRFTLHYRSFFTELKLIRIQWVFNSWHLFSLWLQPKTFVWRQHTWIFNKISNFFN